MSQVSTAPATAGALMPVRSRPGGRWLVTFRTPVGIAAATGVVALVILAIVAPMLWSGRANRTDIGNLLQGPSAHHWAGTDNLGRDIFFRSWRTRLSIELSLLATAIAVLAGLLLGTAGFLFGRR